MNTFEENYNIHKKDILNQLSSVPNEEKAVSSDLIVPSITGEIPPQRKSNEFIGAMSGWVYSAIRPIAQGLGSIEWTLHRVGATGSPTEVSQHAILDLLYKVNPTQTKYDFWQLVGMYLMLVGEAPVFIDKNETTKKPIHLSLLEPHKLKLNYNKSKEEESFLPYNEYLYKLDTGKEIDLNLDEVLFLKLPNPASPYRGLSPLQAAAKTVDIDFYSEDYNRTFFYNSARPDGILTTDKSLTKTQREALKKQLRSSFGGRNSHRTMVLENGFDFKLLGMSQKDMDFMEQQKFSRDKIFSIFGVPKAIAAINEDVNLANAKTAQMVFSQHTLRPLYKQITEQINEFLIPMFGNDSNLYLEYVDPTPSDQEAKLALYQSGRQYNWLTINEIREQEGLNPVPGGDVLSTEVVEPVDNSKKITKRLSQTAYNVRSRVIVAKKNDKLEVDKINKVKDILSENLTNILKQSKLLNNKEVDSKEKGYDIWTALIKATDSFESKFIETTRKEFDRQSQVIIARMNQRGLSDWLLDLQEETEILVRAYLPIMNEIVIDQGKRAMGTTGQDRSKFDARLRPVQKFISDRTYDFSGSMNKTTNKIIKKELQEGIKNGESIDKLQKRITAKFNDFTDSRAKMIARTEVLSASNFATEQAYKQSGVIGKKEWLTAFDERTSEGCMQLNGQVVSVKGRFNYYGAKIAYPPAHPNCRCTLIPVIDI